MRNPVSIILTGSTLFCAFCAIIVSAQSTDITPPETRVLVVKKILLVQDSRGKPFTLPDGLINPFVGRVKIEVAPEVQHLQVPVGLSGPELLSQLSEKVPSTGTLIFGGNAILLLGSKKVKIGEKIPVNHDGTVYELTLVAVTPTNFTVKLGNDVSTRSVRKR